MNSSGRNASFPDRASHSSISHLYWPLYKNEGGKAAYQEKLLIEGMTDQPAASLTSLAKSWLKAPSVAEVSGGTIQGYLPSHRAYRFTYNDQPLRFQIVASEESPIHNLCFEVKNWESRDAKADLKINGVSVKPGPDFRQGVNIDTDGTFTLIVWVGLKADTPQRFEIMEH